MAVFAISFRIADKTTTLGTYQDRYDSFVDLVKASSVDGVWDETSSFILIKNDASTSKALANDFRLLTMIDPEVDLAIVINLSMKSHAVVGTPEEPDLELLMSMR
ncbi:hypothetical protein RMR10_011835 [Agrobacterium rosae]|uniref:hypothetical protein n=1 Tax=Agrobacterium rosae TaxID=1972867 RepID=UPI002A0D5073|nr:hypothetical protein [Agrobacterium rosae]MDX8313318.1 hypothetical protein [Agrobacterium rosae]